MKWGDEYMKSLGTYYVSGTGKTIKQLQENRSARKGGCFYSTHVHWDWILSRW